MNILKCLAVRNVEEATREIPIIDFSPAFAAAPPDPAALWTNVWADGGWQWRS